MKNLRTIALLSMLTALAVVLLFLSSLLPTGRISGSAIASLAMIAAVAECGIAPGAAVYAASSLLAVLLVPDKLVVFLYVAGFGIYAVLKALIERIGKLGPEIVVKLITFNVIAVTGYFAATKLGEQLRLLPEIDLEPVLYAVLLVAGNLVFLLYDFGLTRLIGLYYTRLKKQKKTGE